MAIIIFFKKLSNYAFKKLSKNNSIDDDNFNLSEYYKKLFKIKKKKVQKLKLIV